MKNDITDKSYKSDNQSATMFHYETHHIAAKYKVLRWCVNRSINFTKTKVLTLQKSTNFSYMHRSNTALVQRVKYNYA